MCMPARYRSAAGEEHGLLAQHDRAGCPGDLRFWVKMSRQRRRPALAAQAPRERPLSGAENNTFPTILTVALSPRPQRISSVERPCAASHRLALRYPAERRSVAHSTGISPLRRFSPRRPPVWTWMSLLETARGWRRTTPNQDLFGKLRTSPTGIEELRMTTEQQVRTVRAAGENGAIRPFRVDIPGESLEDLPQHITATRPPP